MRKAWPALAVIAIVSTARHAGAEPQPSTPLALELVWEVPEACPGAESVRRRIGQILRSPLTKPTSAVAKGRIESLPDGRFRLAMAVRTGDVEDVRTVDAASCGTRAEAFAVVVALAIDRSKEVDGVEPPGLEPPASAEAPPAERPPEPNVVRPAKRELPVPRSIAARPQLRAEVGLGAFVAWGPLPDVSVGPILSLGARIERFRVGALGAVSVQQRAAFDRSAGVTFDMVGGGAFGGYMIPIDAFAFGPCVSVEVTHVRARGFGIRLPWDASGTWLTPAFGGRVEARAAKWLGFFASADLLLPISAPIFSLATATGEAVRLHSPGKPSPRLSLGAEVRFP
ncbi:MAG: hypothetical protein K0S65_1370 [Labilithrix sp.]|nr:hypothetical protein [Labilithrix sp.]